METVDWELGTGNWGWKLRTEDWEIVELKEKTPPVPTALRASW